MRGHLVGVFQAFAEAEFGLQPRIARALVRSGRCRAVLSFEDACARVLHSVLLSAFSTSVHKYRAAVMTPPGKLLVVGGRHRRSS
jgi:hypothetical protein